MPHAKEEERGLKTGDRGWQFQAHQRPLRAGQMLGGEVRLQVCVWGGGENGREQGCVTSKEVWQYREDKSLRGWQGK